MPAKDELTMERVMRQAFDGVNAYDPAAIMRCWNHDGVYDNPNVGDAAHGYEAINAAMETLCTGVKSRGEQLVVDRVTVGRDHVVAEWHVEPVNGKRGVHVAEFDGQNRLRRVVVYPRS